MIPTVEMSAQLGGAPVSFSSLGVQLTSHATNVRFQWLDKA